MDANFDQILKELSLSFKEMELDTEILERIEDAKGIFVKGCGRTGFIMNMFAMRLVHLGRNAHVVGETTSAKAGPEDILFLGSGSGETESLLAVAKKAKGLGMNLILFTANKNSALARISDHVILLRARGKYDSQEESISRQPMGALFEQGLMIYLDGIVMAEMARENVTNEAMQERHANLE